MEKQLLNLLEWDLRVTEDDLYCHLDPFLAPIRTWQLRQAEKQRLRDEMFALEQRQMALATQQQPRRAAVEAPRYRESPRSTGQYTYHQPMYYASNSSSRAPSRTPSLSPPTRSNSSADSYASSSSPASITSSYTDPICEEPAVQIQHCDNHHVPSIVHVQPSVPKVPMAVHALPLEQTDVQPAKKQKTNIFSRFLPTTLSRPQLPTIAVTGY